MILSLLLLAETVPNPDWDCDEPITQQKMNWCAHQDFLVADAEMNAQWKLTASQLKDLDKAYGDATNGGHLGYFETLLEGQRAWLKYRDAHCASHGKLISGGSLEPLIINRCKPRLTNLRSTELGILIGMDG